MRTVEDLWHWSTDLSKFDLQRQDRYTPEYRAQNTRRQLMFDNDFAALSFAEQHRFFDNRAARPETLNIPHLRKAADIYISNTIAADCGAHLSRYTVDGGSEIFTKDLKFEAAGFILPALKPNNEFFVPILSVLAEFAGCEVVTKLSRPAPASRAAASAPSIGKGH